MSRIASPSREEQLHLVETAEVLGLAEGKDRTQEGTVLLHLIRPCVGKGRGRHVYEAKMLQEHAEGGHFDNWPMFVDHESPQARAAAGGLPRSLRDLGGRIVRTWWDPTVEADASHGFGKGAVMAEAKPVPWVRELIESDPGFASVSINTFATGVKRVTRGGKAANLVEGFAPEGSADWVTKPGAGGRVVQLLEAAAEEEMPDDEARELLEALPDDKFMEWVRSTRPDVAEALTESRGNHDDEETDMDRAEVQEAALEALTTDEGKTVLSDVIAEAAETAVTGALHKVLPDAIGKAAEVIEQQARTAATHEVRMGRLAERASRKIEEAKLPEKFAADAKARFRELDLQDKTDDDGTVTESAETQLDALVEAEVKRNQDLIASINPTAVNGGGGGGEGDDKDGVRESDEEGRSFYRHELAEADIDIAAAYGVKPKDSAKDKTEPAKPETEAAAA